MIINETEVTERMNSPMNLLNRLQAANGHKRNQTPIISIPPSSSDIIDNLEEKLSYGSIKSKAANIMIAAMDELQKRLPETQKPEQLARITESMSKVVNAETVNEKTDKLHGPQFVLYAPQFHEETHYEVIHSRE